MTNRAEISDGSEPASALEASRMRFQGVAEPAQDRVRPRSFATSTLDRQSRISRAARDMETGCRMVAAFIFAAVFIGWPLGTLLGHFVGADAVTLKGWSLGEAYKGYVLFGLIGPPAFWLLGNLAARLTTMIGAGEATAMAAQKLLQPDELAVANVQTVGIIVRGQMEALNAGIDDALIRLASAEAMIRQHVGAIEQAGAAVETRASSAAERVASERARLIDLTETLNIRADEFATAIAEKAQANIAALENAGTATLSAEARFDDRLARLEAAAQRALQSFEALSHALAGADDQMRQTSGTIETSAAEIARASDLATKIAEAASESAARNAANIGMFAGQAADRARKAADEAIETARRETERASESAVEFAARESRRMAEAAARAVDEAQTATRSAVETVAVDAEKAAAAARLISEAARLTSGAAREASDEVAKAGEAARQSATDAVSLAENAAQQIEARNKELAAARASLEAENARLESLIDEQRKRADRLAEAIATQTERLSKLAENQLREQEAAARLAEAQAQMQKTRAAEAAASAERQARLDAERAVKAADAEAKPTKAAEKSKPQGPAREPDASNVLDLGNSPRQRTPKSAPKPANLDDLAQSIARPKTARDQGDLSKDDERRSKDGVSWREILSATDDAEPLDLGAAARNSADGEQAARAAATNAMKAIAGLQAFTLDLETRLYGEPPPALLERFERGDRNVFANRLLRLNEADVKRRIRAEGSRDKTFERGIHDFLQGFERLLEDATTSATADEELEEYLSSPLGRVYLLVGATVGYFA